MHAFKTIEETLRCLVRFAADTFHEFSRCGPWCPPRPRSVQRDPVCLFSRAPFTQYFVERGFMGVNWRQGLLVEVGIKLSKLPDHFISSSLHLIIIIINNLKKKKNNTRRRNEDRRRRRMGRKKICFLPVHYLR